MQINQQALAQHLQRKIYPLNVIVGQDNYLIEEALITLKSAIQKLHDCDIKNLNVQSVEDWNLVLEEASHYSLFSEMDILVVNYDKKTMDATGKKLLTEYLKSINTRCIILIKAPNLSAKQLSWLSQNDSVLMTIAQPLTAEAMKKWLATKLSAQSLKFDNSIPEVIFQYTKGNMLAAAQVVEKISLVHEPDSLLTMKDVLDQLADQCDYSLFELIDTCLLGQSDKGIHILKQASNNKTESTLVLWLMTQEIRNMLQLVTLIQHGTDFRKACSDLNIWTQRVSLYQQALRRLNQETLLQLHHYCCILDNRIKSSGGQQIWSGLEVLFLSLCLGKLIGDACTV